MKLKNAGGRRKKRNDSINHRYRRHRFNYIVSNRWGYPYPCICQPRWRAPCTALGRIGVVLSLSTIGIQKSSRSLTVKQGKHDAIKLLAQAKLDSITDIISQAVHNRDISPAEFHKVLQEREKYRKLKADIRNQTKAKVKQIEKEQREEILEQGRKEGKEIFLRQIANTSGTQGVNAI